MSRSRLWLRHRSLELDWTPLSIRDPPVGCNCTVQRPTMRWRERHGATRIGRVALTRTTSRLGARRTRCDQPLNVDFGFEYLGQPWSGTPDRNTSLLRACFAFEWQVSFTNLWRVNQTQGRNRLLFRMAYRDDKCLAKPGVRAVMELLLDEDVDVILGPLCSTGELTADAVCFKQTSKTCYIQTLPAESWQVNFEGDSWGITDLWARSLVLAL